MNTHRNLSRMICVAVALVLVQTEQSWALDIVKDGKPVATIVVSNPAPPVEFTAKGKPKRSRRAAKNPGETALLVEWIKKITDVELPVAKAAPAGGVAIYVGDAAIAQGLKLDDIESPSQEGIRIVVDDRRILIAGQSSQATVKATCRFLEALGCRYFMDTHLGEVYPRTKTLSVAPMTITEAPGLTFRIPKGPTWSGGYWKAWNGAGGIPSSHAHSWDRYVKKNLFAEHPEFFAMGKDGVRRPSGWLCTSNPELRKYFAQRVIDTISGGTQNPSLSPPDGTGYCHCPACKAQDDPKVIEASSGMVSISTRYADFFDDVGRRVAKVHPKSMLSFYCYADYTQPPSLGRPLSPNLCAFIAPIRYCRLHSLGDHDCPSRLQQLELVEGWSKVATHLGYYNYMYNLADGTLPMFKFSAYKKEFPYLKDHGLRVMTLEVLSNWHIYGPQLYLGMRLAYDPKADADAIMEDYWTKFYGPAAAPMKAYWMGIDAATEQLKSHSGCFFGFQEVYTPEFLKQCAGHLARAAEAAKTHPTYAARVSLHTEGYRSAQQYREMCDAMAAADYHQALKVLNAMTARLKGLASNRVANPEYATSYLDRFVRQGVTVGSLATLPPARALCTLPDKWRLEFDPDNKGEAQRFHAADFDDSKWVLASTYGQTLSSQGLERTSILWYRTAIDVPKEHGRLTLYFTEVDGWSQVYVNGKKASLPPPPPIPDPAKARPRQIEAAAHSGEGPPRRPFEVDITSLVQPGRNVVAVRVDHTKLTELFLGGILRPVMLIDKGR